MYLVVHKCIHVTTMLLSNKEEVPDEIFQYFVDEYEKLHFFAEQNIFSKRFQFLSIQFFAFFRTNKMKEPE